MALGGWKSEARMRRYAAVTNQTLRAGGGRPANGYVGRVTGGPNGTRTL